MWTGLLQSLGVWQASVSRRGAPFNSHAVVKVASLDYDGSLPGVLRRLWPEDYPTDSAARKACRTSKVLVNGAIAKCGTPVYAGENVEILRKTTRPPAPGEGRRCLATKPLQVIYERDEWAIVFKPAGMPVSGGPEGVVNVRQMLAIGLEPSKTGDEPLWRPQFVHRLDAPTCGLLAIAKTRPALQQLSAAFRERTVKKTYRAILAGDVASADNLDAGVLHEVRSPLSGKEALTEWRMLETFDSNLYGKISLCELYPHTGRTHQLRRHMASLGHPSTHPHTTHAISMTIFFFSHSHTFLNHITQLSAMQNTGL